MKCSMSWVTPGIKPALTASNVADDISGGWRVGALVISRVEPCQFVHAWTEGLGRV